ncbi:unnamed protein product [Cercopithifilaria johnstoni]|uniref:Ground-like domain-containing protein n=1 Tax=Cercopithifilaria johnstoni TaxID=2874296 RepID=A0A8J2M7L0_9BILA|nr:unnamed protein product [Cercopithifilaria johnstoni]
MRNRGLLVLVILLEFSILGHAMLFGGVSSCCCQCGIPMPLTCGCPPPQPLPICPPPLLCPPPICPICEICSGPPSCPSPPAALCPPPQPIYLPSSSCSCGATNTGVGSYASPKGKYFGPQQGGIVRKDRQIAGLAVSRGGSPPSIHPNHLQGSERADLGTQQLLPSIRNEAGKSADPTDLDITNQIAPLSSTAISVTERRPHGDVIISENKCNSVVLKDLLIKNIDQTDPVISKRSVHKAARESMKEDEVDIICSNAGFTYIISTTEYCEAQKEKVICFVYKKS